MKNTEFKTAGLVKDVDTEKRIVTGFFTSTGTLDSDMDIFADGAFKKTIKELGPKGKNRIWHLYQHDHFSPINKPYLVEERSEGVYFETKFPKTPLADMVLALYAEGANPEHSVGFQVMKDETDRKKNTRIITEVRMLEGSTVLWGANENTKFTGLKGEDVKNTLEMYERLLKSSIFTNEELKELIEGHMALIQIALQPGTPLEPQEEVEPQKALELRKEVILSNLLKTFKR